ncbi:unnamed protein product [Orchesella dallaii]|uniref:Uncharacterized protein n=1 Tax=Orchesella dallaii TaxID=48710 RepID=A0ABP1Q9H1_9HEXA
MLILQWLAKEIRNGKDYVSWKASSGLRKQGVICASNRGLVLDYTCLPCRVRSTKEFEWMMSNRESTSPLKLLMLVVLVG